MTPEKSFLWISVGLCVLCSVWAHPLDYAAYDLDTQMDNDLSELAMASDEVLTREKKASSPTTVCVEINPQTPYERSYMMCKDKRNYHFDHRPHYHSYMGSTQPYSRDYYVGSTNQAQRPQQTLKPKGYISPHNMKGVDRFGDVRQKPAPHALPVQPLHLQDDLHDPHRGFGNAQRRTFDFDFDFDDDFHVASSNYYGGGDEQSYDPYDDRYDHHGSPHYPRPKYTYVHVQPPHAHEQASAYESPAPVHHVPAPAYESPAPAPVHHAPAPAYESAAPAPVHHAPAPAYESAAPAPVHHAPAPAYHAPVPAYHAPAPAYHAPAPAYHAPAPAYHSHEPTYHSAPEPVHHHQTPAHVYYEPYAHPTPAQHGCSAGHSHHYAPPPPPPPSYHYSPPTTSCGQNLVLSCTPNVSPAPCSQHGGHGGHGGHSGYKSSDTVAAQNPSSSNDKGSNQKAPASSIVVQPAHLTNDHPASTTPSAPVVGAPVEDKTPSDKDQPKAQNPANKKQETMAKLIDMMNSSSAQTNKATHNSRSADTLPGKSPATYIAKEPVKA